jgi:hypothetical protein
LELMTWVEYCLSFCKCWLSLITTLVKLLSFLFYALAVSRPILFSILVILR